MYIHKISSLKNDRVKTWRSFSRNSFRKKSPYFFVEGLLEVKRGLNSDFEIAELIYCPGILELEEQKSILNKIDNNCNVYEVDQQIYSKLAYRDDSEGLIGIFKKKHAELSSVSLKENENNLILILENLEKPGNLGAILRTADAVGASAVILSGKGMDIYNPNAIRASIGSFFSVPIYQASNSEVMAWLTHSSLDYLCAALPAYKGFYETKLQQNIAFVFGAEHDGLSDFWLKDSKRIFTLPMHGVMDSLNLSVSVAVVSYEYLRQFPRT